jgi:transposase
VTPAQLKTARERAAHVRDVLAGDDQNALGDRIRARAAMIGVAPRTLERWIAAYREAGEAGLVDSRSTRVVGTTIAPR